MHTLNETGQRGPPRENAQDKKSENLILAGVYFKEKYEITKMFGPHLVTHFYGCPKITKIQSKLFVGLS